MIREVVGTISVNVKTKEGHFFKNCDVPENFTTDGGSIIAFWFEDKLKVYNLTEISYYEIIEEDKIK